MITMLKIVGFGLAGGILGEMLTFTAARRRDSEFFLDRAAIAAAIAAVWTTLYFLFVDSAWVPSAVVLHYGVFIALLVDEVIKPTARPTGTTSSRAKSHIIARLQAAVPATPVLVLNGFWPVYWMGTFGGFVAELYILYKDRGSAAGLQYSTRDWVVTILMIFVSGVMATLYGVTNVSGLLAIQLGASAPLIISRLIK